MGQIPTIPILRERTSGTNFILKGFPNATRGDELACVSPTWIQTMPDVKKFQLLLHEDYNSWAIGGFSGSGVFLLANDQLYLLGIFTRFRPEGKGKVIYCQYVEAVNNLLTRNFLKQIPFSFFAEYGLTPSFFKKQVSLAIENLGPRYNESLNFKLPIATLFNDISRDSIFRARLLKVIDDWLTANGYRSDYKDEQLKDIENELNELKKNIVLWVQSVDWKADKKIDIEFIPKTVNNLNIKLDNRRTELYELQRLETEKEGEEKKKSYNYRPPFEHQIDRVYEILRSNNDFINNLDSVNTFLSNNPYLLIQGEAGCGKSHLLGDIASERNKNSTPTILLLGQLFLSGQNAWQNILAQLGLTCSPEQLLVSLNSIGKQIGVRILVMIDAINEGAGKEIWPNELSGFVNEFKAYPFIGVVFTVRSTYYNIVVPESIKSKKEVTKIVHEGFKGNEYAALKLFCEHHGLEQPNFPILSPEFSSPLFLQLICYAVMSSESKKFPQGFQGINSIFKLYLEAITTRLAQKRDEYRLRKHVIVEAIYDVARAIFEQERLRAIKLTEAVNLFDSKYSGYRNLLNDLIHENVFIQSTNHNYDTTQNDEIILFSYERLGDFYITKELLAPYLSKERAKQAFTRGQVLGNLINDYYWRNRGVLEVMSILLPEKYELEIFEAFDWVFSETENEFSNADDWLNQFLLESLKWREIGSINEKKLIAWFRSKHFRVSQSNLFNTFIELTTQIGNPFNSDKFFQILNKHSLPKRDSFWLEYIRYYSTYDDNGVAFPIRRLMDWAWQPGISPKIDMETARLGGQTLAWVLASTKINLRDEITKALVNLLEEQPEALLSILKSFKDCNDLYVVERLYGVAYGCALRTSKTSSVQKIAQYVFNNIFNGSSISSHILLRDYARNTIEYAIYLKLKLTGDLKKIRPPYGSSMPKSFPTEDDIKKFKASNEATDYKLSHGFYNNQIEHSVMKWDFGRYVVDPALRQFTPVSFTFENELKDLKKRLSSAQRKWISIFESYVRLSHEYKMETNLPHRIGKEAYTQNEKVIQQALKDVPKTLKKMLPKKEYEFVIKDVVNHIRTLVDSKNWQRNELYTESIKRWIVKRVFEMGYDSRIHGHYESGISYYNEHSENKFERIGKKYQWIALYEIMGNIADNYYVKIDRWSTTTELGFYQGAWQSYLRNIDPAFITKNKPEVEDDIENTLYPRKWWHVPNYSFWNRPDSKWVASKIDLPDITQIITTTDESGKEWLCLSSHIKWRSPKPIGEEKYGGKRKEIWYSIQAYLVRKRDKAKIIKHLKTRTFWNRWMPESHRANSSLFNRENYWSPAAKEFGSEQWEEIEGSSFKVMVTTSEAVGETSRDKSGAHFRYDMPCQMLFEGMGLKYSANDGEFLSKNGETIVINPDERGVLFRKDHLLKYLKSKNLELVWTLLGEKYSFETISSSGNFFKVLNGVYTFSHNNLTGTVRMTNRN